MAKLFNPNIFNASVFNVADGVAKTRLFNQSVFASPPMFNTGESVVIPEPEPEVDIATSGGPGWYYELARYEYARRMAEAERRAAEAERKRIEEYEAQKAREAEEVREERARRVYAEQVVSEVDREEAEALVAGIERLQAEMNAHYRAEMARRQEAKRREINAIIMMLLLTEV